MGTSHVAPRKLPELQRERARNLRNEATPSERLMWSRLRASNLGGHKFSRQISIGPFICDLVCRQARLVVELDGSQHGGAYDAHRTRYLEGEGFAVMRFWNHQVLQDVEAVLVTILARLEEIVHSPRPAPPASGRGEA